MTSTTQDEMSADAAEEFAIEIEGTIACPEDDCNGTLEPTDDCSVRPECSDFPISRGSIALR